MKPLGLPRTAGWIALLGLASCASGAPLPDRLVVLEDARIDAIVEKEGGPSPGRRAVDVQRNSAGDGLVITVIEQDGKRTYALDLDPWSDQILIAEMRDPPLSALSAWYLYDMRTERLVDLGRRTGRGLFLTADPFRGRDE